MIAVIYPCTHPSSPNPVPQPISNLGPNPGEKLDLDRRLEDLTRRVQYIEERLRIVQRSQDDDG